MPVTPFCPFRLLWLPGCCSGFVTALLQTKMGVDSLLAGIIVNTGLYSINIAVMGGSSLLNMNKTDTVFTLAKDSAGGHPPGRASTSWWWRLVAVAVP